MTLFMFILIVLNISLSFLFLILWIIFKMPTLFQIYKFEYRVQKSLPKPQKIPPFEKYFLILLYRSNILQLNFEAFFQHLVSTVLGLTVSPLFLTMTLFLIVHINKLSFGIFKSIELNFSKLMFTLIMMLIIINSFSYIIAEKFRNNFDSNGVGPQNDIICNSFFRCFFNTINLGMRGGGGISDYMFFNGSLD